MTGAVFAKLSHKLVDFPCLIAKRLAVHEIFGNMLNSAIIIGYLRLHRLVAHVLLAYNVGLLHRKLVSMERSGW